MTIVDISKTNKDVFGRNYLQAVALVGIRCWFSTNNAFEEIYSFRRKFKELTDLA